MSLFASTDQSHQNPSEFWSAYVHDSSPLLLVGELTEVLNANFWEENTYLLSSRYLFKMSKRSKSPEFMASVEWKLIEPFIEENETSMRYGFVLGHSGCSKDFYTRSETELQMWLEKLSSVGIMTGIKDSFEFKQVIGNGAFSTVYLAKCINDNKSYAIKAISKQKIAKMTENLLKEIKIMRKIKHPNIVNLYKVYESHSNVYLVLDLVEGGDLFSRITEKKKFPEDTVKKFARNFLKVLDYLNAEGIIHRDIKLENVLLKSKENDYDFKLADFGLAVEVQENSKLRCGSPGYVAPEILRKQPYGIKVDTFSLGIIMYILLTGKMPFFGQTPQKILEKNMHCNINFNEETLRQISQPAINLLEKITCVCPDLRITPEDALLHSWFSSPEQNNSRSKISSIEKSKYVKRQMSKSSEKIITPSMMMARYQDSSIERVQYLRQKLNELV